MSSIQALRERLAASNKAAKHILAEKGDQTWTKEDQTAFDNHMEDAERTQNQIDAHERLNAQNREENHTDVEDFRRTGPAKAKAKSAATIGFENYLRKSMRDMNDEERRSVLNVMSTTTGSQGGFTVQSEIANNLIDALKSYGFMRKVASQITTAKGNPLSYSSSDGTSEEGEWLAENAPASSADPTFGTVPLNVFKVGSRIFTIPLELLQDSEIDVQAMVMNRARNRIGRTSNKGFTTGNGTTSPNGLVTASGVGKIGASGQTLTVIYDDLVDLVDSLDVAYLDVPETDPQLPGARPGWMFNQTIRRVIRKLKDTAGRPIWTPSYDAGIGGGAKTPDELLGYPVNINNDMATPAANAKSIAFGNLNQYLIRDALDVTMFRFDDSAYISKGQVGFLAWARTGGNLLDVNSVKLYQHPAS